MSTVQPGAETVSQPVAFSGKLTLHDYDVMAQEYLESLPLEHFMESTPHATQREVFLASLRVLKLRRPDVHYFSELLVQYPTGVGIAGEIGQVVPDNMIVLGKVPSRDRTNYPAALEPEPPFMVLEYVSPDKPEKDYRDSFAKYQNDLRPKYCVFFDPHKTDLRFYRHDGSRFERLELNDRGRIAVPEIECEFGVHDRWMRIWHRGQLLPLPDELIGEMEAQALLIEQQAGRIEQQAGQIERQTATIDELTSILVGHVMSRATAAGRQDILDELAQTRDAKRLQAWLLELS
jgi:Uma2 family endonuclease